MALFNFSEPAAKDILNGKIRLGEPKYSDFDEWRALRLASRAFLEKWEPSWSDDEFARHAFRQRVNTYRRLRVEGSQFSYFVFSRETSNLVGGLTLSHVRRGVSQAGTVGYWVGEAFARQGFMKSAIQALAIEAATNMELHRLEAACLPHNEASRRLLLSCGFEPEGYAKSYVKIAGRWEDHLLFGRRLDQAVAELSRSGLVLSKQE